LSHITLQTRTEPNHGEGSSAKKDPQCRQAKKTTTTTTSTIRNFERSLKGDRDPIPRSEHKVILRNNSNVYMYAMYAIK
jgi:hypothetical protein